MQVRRTHRGGYSAIRHLADIAWGHPRNPARSYLAVYRVYYDASSEEGEHGVVAIAGIVASELRWQKFEREWPALLKRHGVAHIHMKNRMAMFRGWTQEQEDAFLLELTLLIKRRSNRVFLRVVPIKDFDLLKSQESPLTVGLLDNAYSTALSLSIGAADKWIRDVKKPAKATQHVVERDDCGQGVMRAWAQYVPDVNISFFRKEDEYGTTIWPFEPVDYLAWECRRACVDRQKGISNRRASVLAIEKHLRPDFAEMMPGGMQQMHDDGYVSPEPLTGLIPPPYKT